MTRCFSFLFLFLILGSTGCRMCGSSYDYCMPAFLDRQDDYRGCDSLYRAGSIYQNVACQSGCGEEIALTTDRSLNAGNFGVTTSVDAPLMQGPKRPGGGSTLGKPPTGPILNGDGFDVPTQGVEELLQDSMPSRPTPLMPTPLVPTPMEGNPPPATSPEPFVPVPPSQQSPVETMPLTMPSSPEPTITVEDLRRLDPSVTDIKIINIDDSLDTTAKPARNPSR